MAVLNEAEKRALGWLATHGDATHHDLWLAFKGVSFETVYRALNSLSKKGLLERNGEGFYASKEGERLHSEMTSPIWRSFRRAKKAS